MLNSFVYTPTVLRALEASLSSEGLTAYRRDTGGKLERALGLYHWNTEISAALYGPLQGLEVAMRNAVHRELSTVYGAFWYDHPALPLSPVAKILLRDAKATIAQRQKPVIPPRVVAELSFGFWVSLLGPWPERSL